MSDRRKALETHRKEQENQYTSDSATIKYLVQEIDNYDCDLRKDELDLVFTRIRNIIEYDQSLSSNQITHSISQINVALSSMQILDPSAFSTYEDTPEGMNSYDIACITTGVEFEYICEKAISEYKSYFNNKIDELKFQFIDRKTSDSNGKDISFPTKLLILKELGTLDKVDNFDINRASQAKLLVYLIGSNHDTLEKYLPVNNNDKKKNNNAYNSRAYNVAKKIFDNLNIPFNLPEPIKRK